MFQAASAALGCVEPENATAIIDSLKERLERTYMASLEHVALNVPQRLHTPLGQDSQDTGLALRYQATLAGERGCHQRSRRQNEISELSSCPWYFVMDFDPDRIPSTLARAKCSCVKCLSASTVEDEVPFKIVQRRGRCRAVNSYLPVIRKYCIPGEYKYNIVQEQLTVGCTCFT